MCNLCNPLQETDIDIHRAMNEMALTCMELTVQRLDNEAARRMGFPVSKQVKLTRDNVPFVEMELAAALALLEDALSLVPEMQAIIGPTLREAMNADEVYDAIAKADAVWRRQSFGKGTASKWEEAITLAVAAGVWNANDAVKVDKMFRDRIISGMVRAGKYYTNEFFSRQVMPALHTAVERALTGDNAGSKAGYRAVQEVLTKRLKTVPYWSTVANGAASRAYHYGLLRGGWEAGIRRYVFEAVMDDRTTDICRSLHGTTWYVAEALAHYERVAQAEHPEDLKTIHPYMNARDMEEALNGQAIHNMSLVYPPLHHRCRSIISLL